MSEVFDDIYKTGLWGSSGPGSHPSATMDYRNFLEKFMYLNSIKSVVDIGCGDWQSSRHIDFSRVKYCGYDVAKAVVERNREQFAKGQISFEVMPADLSHVNSGDLLLMKDVLQHLSNEEILAFLEVVVPKFQFALLTNSYAKINTNATELSWLHARQNVEIKSGAFRCLNLLKEPFCVRGANVHEHYRPWERSVTTLITN